jgi:hypothetical protein
MHRREFLAASVSGLVAGVVGGVAWGAAAKLFFPEEYPDIIAAEARLLWDRA